MAPQCFITLLAKQSVLIYTEQQKKRPVSTFLYYLKLKYQKYISVLY